MDKVKIRLIKVEENKKKYWEILKGNSVYEIVD
jgi:hypothetical protein